MKVLPQTQTVKDEYFAREMAELHLLEADGLVRLNGHKIEVTPTGRLLLRNIASIFDSHTRKRQNSAFSRTI